MKKESVVGQTTLFGPDGWCGKTSQEHSAAKKAKISERYLKKPSELLTVPYQYLDLRMGYGSLLGPLWEIGTPLPGVSWMPATGPSPKDAVESSLSQILEDSPHIKYSLSQTACLGILRRAQKRGKDLPPILEHALKAQAIIPQETMNRIKKQSSQASKFRAKAFHKYGYSKNDNEKNKITVTAFACNQRDEVRDLQDVSGAIVSRPGMKQHTFVTQHNTECLTPWDTQQSRITSADGVSPTVSGADGGGGRNPAGLIFASFSPHAGSQAANIGYEQNCAPTLKGAGGGNMVPGVLCLNDQGGCAMDISYDQTGCLRSQMKGHEPIILTSNLDDTEKDARTESSCENKPVIYESHKMDSRYTGSENIAPTVTSSFGTGGNNVPLTIHKSYSIAGNIIDRQDKNGGNGFGYQDDISYTLNTTDRHCVFSQQRSDEYIQSDLTCTQAARQYKDSTDLVCDVSGLDLRSGAENGDISGTIQAKGNSLQSIHPLRIGNLVRRLTPLECERLQGFPDYYTEIKGSSDSARYRALGNSVAIPCVEYVLDGINSFLKESM